MMRKNSMHTYEKILQAIGEASMCWSEEPKGFFDSEKAIKIAKKLYLEVMDIKFKEGNKSER
jgi:hypothetical protein